MLEHRGLKPSLGAAEDLESVGRIGRGEDEIPAGPAVETEEPGLVARVRRPPGVLAGRDPPSLQHLGERGVEGVVENLGITTPDVRPRDCDGVGQVAAVNDGTAAARTADQGQAHDA